MTSIAVAPRPALWLPGRTETLDGPDRDVKVDRRLVRPEHRELAAAVGTLLRRAARDLAVWSKTDFSENIFAQIATGQATGASITTTPVPQFIAIYTVAPGETAAGTEATGGWYARQNSSGKWAAPTTGAPTTTSTNAALTYSAVTGAGLSVVGVGWTDAASAGNIWRWVAISGVAFAIGDQATFPSGSLTVTED